MEMRRAGRPLGKTRRAVNLHERPETSDTAEASKSEVAAGDEQMGVQRDGDVRCWLKPPALPNDGGGEQDNPWLRGSHKDRQMTPSGPGRRNQYGSHCSPSSFTLPPQLAGYKDLAVAAIRQMIVDAADGDTDALEALGSQYWEEWIDMLLPGSHGQIMRMLSTPQARKALKRRLDERRLEWR